jgi:hypothetical protein
MWISGFAVIWLVLVGLTLTTDHYAGSTSSLVIGGVLIAEMLWIQTFGVDLTRKCAVVRGIRRQSIPWQHVQAVLPFEQLGTGRVCLVLESGQRVNLRAPSSFMGLGGARYERDFHRIGQWWLAHRGQGWRPLPPEAPQPPV